MQDDESRRNRTEFIINNMKDWLETRFINGIPASNYGPKAYAAMKTGNCSICKNNLYSLWKTEKFDKMSDSDKEVYKNDGIEKLGPAHMQLAKSEAKIKNPNNNSFEYLPLFTYSGRPMNNVKAKAKASGGRKRRRSRRKSRRGNKSRKSRRKRRKSRKKRKRRTRRRRRR